MAREIVIDTDTVIGYNFLVSKFYIENKGTIAYRETSELAKEVLDIVAPSSSITLEEIQALQDTYETLQDLYYTLYDNGSFIKTIQLNTYSKYPLVLDAFKKKLYIMNTNLIFDLTLNEGKQYRIDYLISYYKDNIGLAITQQEMSSLYDLLLYYYDNQVVYNEIDLTKLTSSLTTLYYNTIYSSSNYKGTGKVVYSCTENPNSNFTKTDTGDIIGLDQVNKQITLLNTPTTLKIGQQVFISGLTITLNGVEYTADGTYTLTNQEDNILTVEEPLLFSYTYPYIQVILLNSITNIQEISRDDLTITLTTTVPSTINIGDIVFVSGTQQEVDNQTVTADGSYTVASISSNKITVQEQPQANYTYSSGTYPSLTKHIEVGSISKISSSKITLDKSLTTPLSTGSKLLITDTVYTVKSCTTKTITVEETIEDYTPTYSKLQVNTPYEEILIDITTSKSTYYPTGSFMVDNFTQCEQYITTYPNAPVPSLTNHNNISSPVPTTMTITGLPTLQLKGIYSKIYTEK